MNRFFLGLVLGVVVGLVPGFMLGVYFLPILTAEAGAERAVVEQAMAQALRRGVFRRDLDGSDWAHWGEGDIVLSVEQGRQFFTLNGEVAPGPDYKLYLTPELAVTKEEFLAIKDRSARVASIKAYRNFRVEVPASINPSAYAAVLIWCESFSEFITAAELR